MTAKIDKNTNPVAVKRKRDRSKEAKSIVPALLQPYIEFYNRQSTQFFDGAETTFRELETTTITAIGDRLKDLGKDGAGAKCPLVGTVWKGSEKNRFFEFLGRYGIHQIERIQEHIPGKSILEIKNYYDLLSKASKKLSSRATFESLASYQKMPIAIEVDEDLINIENYYAKELRIREVRRFTNLSKHRRHMDGYIRDKFIPNSIVNYELLEKTTEFYKKNNHAIEPLPGYMKNVDSFLWHDSYLYIESTVMTFAKDMVKQIIIDRLQKHFKSNEIVEIDDPHNPELLGIGVSERHVWKAFENLNVNRPKGMKPYFQQLADRLNVEIVDEDRPISKLEVDMHDPDGRPVRKFVNNIEFEGLSKRGNAPPSYDDKTLQAIQINEEEEESLEERKFIVNDPDDDEELLDHAKAWFVLSMETEELDELDDLVKIEVIDDYLRALGVDVEDFKQEYIAEKNGEEIENDEEPDPGIEFYQDDDYLSDAFLEELDEDELKEVEALDRIENPIEYETDDSGEDSRGQELRDIKKARELKRIEKEYEEREIEDTPTNGYEITPEMQLMFSYLFAERYANDDIDIKF